ncbi:MAG: S41 family peptidase, partial [Planctomycetota bacterium]
MAMLVLWGLSTSLNTAAARPVGPQQEDRPITLAVQLLMERQHLTNRRIDNTISQRWLDSYLKSLDPWKLYFYQSDIDEFSRNRDSLDDMIRRQDIRFAYTVFSRFLARVDERVDTALAQVDAPHDFTADDRMIRDRDAATYPKTPEEATERWRQRVKFDLMTQIADEVAMDEAKQKLRRRYGSVRRRWQQTSDDELLELYLTSMTSAFDPHSSYLSPTTLENFEITMKLELDGIGAELRSVDGYTEVTRIVAGGAADREGSLKKGDQIVGVGQGTSGEVDDVVDVKLNDVVKKIRGKRGTVVRLLVKPVDNPNTTVVYTITRDRIELKDQEARSVILETGGDLLPGVVKPNGQAYRIGVINLPSFYLDMTGAREGKANFRSTTRDVRRLLEEFNRDGVDIVVVDLRYNGGGAMQEAVNMTGLFIDQGPVVQVKDPSGQTQALPDREPGMVWSGPLAVLTNKFSASASEIFAGAIKDYGRGVVIGDTSTHGKGTVQQVFDIGERLFRAGQR